MPPTDNTPSIDMGAFELTYSLLAYNKIPVSEYKSKDTGLTVVLAEVEGPVVNGFFCVGKPYYLHRMCCISSAFRKT